MAIPDHVKKQAMDAVSHRETTAFMHLYGYSSDGASVFSRSGDADPAKSRLSVDVKQQALDAVSHRETTAHIRLVEDSGSVFAPTTPSRASADAAQRISDLHRTGICVDSVQRQITQDGFEKFYG
jgi:hypothetical protein